MFAEINPILVHSKKILDKLPGELHRVNAIDNIPAGCKYPLVSVQNWRQNDTGSLAKCLEFKVATKVMITINIDIEERLINGRAGEVSGFRILDNAINEIYLKFQDPQIGRKAMMFNEFTRADCVVQLEKCEEDLYTSIKGFSST